MVTDFAIFWFRPYEYDVLIWFAEHRTAVFDIFFLAGTMLGTSFAYMMLIPLLFGLLERNKACVYASVILISILITCIIKVVIAVHRPDPSIVLPLYTELAKGYSFPSGHAQGSMTIWGLLALENFRKPWISIVSASMILWISLSRLYLGVHFPVDIVAGWLFGIVILAVYVLMKTARIHVPYIVACAGMVALALVTDNHRIQILSATLAGIYAGMIIGGYDDLKPLKRAHPVMTTASIFLGCGVILALGKLSGIPEVMTYMLLGLWISYLSVYAVHFLYGPTSRFLSRKTFLK